MKAARLVILGFLFLPACKTPPMHATPPSQPARHVDKADIEYFESLEKILSKMDYYRPTRLLNDYVRYLKTYDVSFAKSFVENLKELAKDRGQKIEDPDLTLFEGSSRLCWAPDQGYCIKSIGNLTDKYFFPKLNDELHIEILLVYSASVEADGAEKQSMKDICDQIKNTSAITAIKKTHEKFFKVFSPCR